MGGEDPFLQGPQGTQGPHAFPPRPSGFPGGVPRPPQPHPGGPHMPALGVPALGMPAVGTPAVGRPVGPHNQQFPQPLPQQHLGGGHGSFDHGGPTGAMPAPRPEPVPQAIPRADPKHQPARERRDLRDEFRTPEDGRESLTTYYVYRFEKIADGDRYNAEGEKTERSTWKDAWRTEVRDMPRNAITSDIRRLSQPNAHSLGEKRKKLNSFQKRQVETTLEKLQKADPDPTRFEITLVQLDDERRELTEQEYEVYCRQKYGKSAKLSYHATSTGGQIKKRKKKKRTAIIAYYKRCPRPEADVELLLREKAEEAKMLERQHRAPKAGQRPSVNQQPQSYQELPRPFPQATPGQDIPGANRGQQPYPSRPDQGHQVPGPHAPNQGQPYRGPTNQQGPPGTQGQGIPPPPMTFGPDAGPRAPASGAPPPPPAPQPPQPPRHNLGDVAYDPQPPGPGHDPRGTAGGQRPPAPGHGRGAAPSGNAWGNSHGHGSRPRSRSRGNGHGRQENRHRRRHRRDDRSSSDSSTDSRGDSRSECDDDDQSSYGEEENDEMGYESSSLATSDCRSSGSSSVASNGNRRQRRHHERRKPYTTRRHADGCRYHAKHERTHSRDGPPMNAYLFPDGSHRRPYSYLAAPMVPVMQAPLAQPQTQQQAPPLQQILHQQQPLGQQPPAQAPQLPQPTTVPHMASLPVVVQPQVVPQAAQLGNTPRSEDVQEAFRKGVIFGKAEGREEVIASTAGGRPHIYRHPSSASTDTTSPGVRQADPAQTNRRLNQLERQINEIHLKGLERSYATGTRRSRRRMNWPATWDDWDDEDEVPGSRFVEDPYRDGNLSDSDRRPRMRERDRRHLVYEMQRARGSDIRDELPRSFARGGGMGRHRDRSDSRERPNPFDPRSGPRRRISGYGHDGREGYYY